MFKKRLKALESKVAQDGIIFNRISCKAKKTKEAHGEIESEHPG